MTVVQELLARIPQRTAKQITVVCVTEAPNFTIYIDGDSSVAFPARIQAGSTFSSGDSGYATWTPPSLPICFKAT
jgi:hypothetical protein